MTSFLSVKGPTGQKITYSVPADQRIHVVAGDVIGWSSPNGVLGYDNGGNATRVISLGPNMFAHLQPGQEYAPYVEETREYSIMANVKPFVGMSTSLVLGVYKRNVDTSQYKFHILTRFVDTEN